MQNMHLIFEELETAIKTNIRLEYYRGVIIGMTVVLKRPITYKELTEVVGGSPRTQQLATALGELVALDIAAGRPLISALVVNAKTRIPGDGFFNATGFTTERWLVELEKFDQTYNWALEFRPSAQEAV